MMVLSIKYKIKVVLELLTLLCVCYIFQCLTEFDIFQYRIQEDTWQYLLLPNLDVDVKGDESGTSSKHVYTTEQAVYDANNCIDTYFSLNKSVDMYYYVQDDGTITITPPPFLRMTANYINGTHRTFNLTVDDMGPFDGSYESLDTFFFYVNSIDIMFKARQAQLLDSYRNCIVWDVRFRMELGDGGHLYESVHTEADYCSGINSGYTVFSLLPFLSLILVVLCVTSFFITLFILYDWYHLYIKQDTSGDPLHVRLLSVETKNEEEQSQHSLNMSVSKLDPSFSDGFIDLVWLLTSISGDFLLFIGAWRLFASKVLHVVLGHVRATDIMGMLGMGSLLCCLRVCASVSYLGGEYKLLNGLLRFAAPLFLQIILGLLPIFVGFSLCGLVMFQLHNDKFATLTDSMMTLFSVVQGDIIMECFDGVQYFYSRIYLYTFEILFILIANPTVLIFMEYALQSYLANEKRDNASSEESMVKLAKEAADEAETIGGVRNMMFQLREMEHEQIISHEHDLKWNIETKDIQYDRPQLQLQSQEEKKKSSEKKIEAYTWKSQSNIALNQKKNQQKYVKEELLRMIDAVNKQCLLLLTDDPLFDQEQRNQAITEYFEGARKLLRDRFKA